MSRVLLLAATTGYQIRAFGEAAERMGIDLAYATDRCHVIEDPWQDDALPIRFHDEEASAAAIVEASKRLPIDGVLAVGDRPTVIAARVLQALGIAGNPPEAAAVARNKRLTRERFRAAGLQVPWFRSIALIGVGGGSDTTPTPGYPAVVKPLALAASRGVMRVNSERELIAALHRLRALLQAPDIRSERDEANEEAVLIEGFIEGREFAVEGILEHGTLRVLAIFDKPDPLDGPFFEETIYVTPSTAASSVQEAIGRAVQEASDAIGLYHGPVHAECRVNDHGVFVLEVAARPIGGLCARSLRFEDGTQSISLEELLLRHALGESVAGWTREGRASGVMMIPIPKRGIYRRVTGVERARQVPNVEDIRVTAKPDQLLVPLPEGASYLGFIFARGHTPAAVEDALRESHRRLDFTIDNEVRVLQSRHG